MKIVQVVGIVFVVLGILALVYGGFSFTEEKHDVEIGPVELQVAEKERVKVPAWLGIGGIVVGLVLLVAGRRA